MRARAPFAWLALLVLLVACGNDQATPSPSDGTTPIEGALHFDEAGPLRVNPGTHVALALVGAASDELVRVWLDGDYLDASLDRGIVSLSTGRTDLVLIAPSASTAFTVRARQGAVTTRLAVTVTPEGSATLRVTPQPQQALRPVPSFVAGVFTNQTCAQLTDHALPTVDGSPSVEGPPGATLVLSPVPAGVPMALLVRGLHYVAGCKDLPRLEADSTTDIDVPVSNRDLDLGGAFQAALSFEPDAAELTAWRAAFAPIQAAWVDQFLPSGTDEATWLLDAMRDVAAAQSITAGTEFTAKRTAGNWNATTASWLGAHAPSVRARTAALVDAGLAAPPSPLGLVVQRGASAGSGVAAPTSLGGRALVGEWITAPAVFNWSADPADVLRLEGVFTVQPGSFVSFGADRAAAPSADLASSLAQSLDCGGLAQSLVGSGVSYTGCDVACTANACRAALRVRATQAASAVDDAEKELKLAMNASAKADVTERAEVKSFAGTWNGTVTVAPAASPFGIHGTVTGAPH